MHGVHHSGRRGEDFVRPCHENFDLATFMTSKTNLDASSLVPVQRGLGTKRVKLAYNRPPGPRPKNNKVVLNRSAAAPPPWYNATSKPCAGVHHSGRRGEDFVRPCHERIAQRERHPRKSAARAARRIQALSSPQYRLFFLFAAIL